MKCPTGTFRTHPTAAMNYGGAGTARGLNEAFLLDPDNECHTCPEGSFGVKDDQRGCSMYQLSFH